MDTIDFLNKSERFHSVIHLPQIDQNTEGEKERERENESEIINYFISFIIVNGRAIFVGELMYPEGRKQSR